jgi:hypothetical protein
MDNQERFRNMLGEPMNDKSVDELPGIDFKAAEILINLGYDYAYVLFGKYLVMQRNKDVFINWLISKTKMKRQYAELCVTCLEDWAVEYI